MNYNEKKNTIILLFKDKNQVNFILLILIKKMRFKFYFWIQNFVEFLIWIIKIFK